MGLDMYLTKEIYIGAEFEHNGVTGEIEIYKNKTFGSKEKRKVKVDLNKVSSIKESCYYWRKANQIHNWFVQNVMDGEDECREFYVPYSTLMALKKVCYEVMQDHSKAPELLPTSEGFFFGSTEYDDDYFEYVEDTYNMLNNLEEESFDVSYTYRASW